MKSNKNTSGLNIITKASHRLLANQLAKASAEAGISASILSSSQPSLFHETNLICVPVAEVPDTISKIGEQHVGRCRNILVVTDITGFSGTHSFIDEVWTPDAALLEELREKTIVPVCPIQPTARAIKDRFLKAGRFPRHADQISKIPLWSRISLKIRDLLTINESSLLPAPR